MNSKNIRMVIFLIILLSGIILMCSRWNNYINEKCEKEDNSDFFITIPTQQSLDIENPEKAAVLAKATTVRLEVSTKEENWTGTAVVWDQTEDELILLTTAHLIEKTDKYLAAVIEENYKNPGIYICEVLGLSDELDLGVVSLSKSEIPEEVLEQVCCVRLHQRTYDTIIEGDRCFTIGSSLNGTADVEHALVFTKAGFEEEGIGEELFLFEGACEPGMSGSGVFDGYGHFVGMVIAADEERTLAIPMSQINAEVGTLTGTLRNTRDY